jgi:hypothetical protein
MVDKDTIFGRAEKTVDRLWREDAKSRRQRLPDTPGNSADIWAGILAYLHPSLHLPAYVRSGILQSRQVYSSGGCTGITALRSITGFPFNAILANE